MRFYSSADSALEEDQNNNMHLFSQLKKLPLIRGVSKSQFKNGHRNVGVVYRSNEVEV